MEAIKTIIDKGIKSNLTRAQIEGALLLEGYSKAETANAIKDAGLSRTKSGFRAELYATLEVGPLDAKEFAKMIKDESNNVKKHESHYNEIRLLINKVWESKA